VDAATVSFTPPLCITEEQLDATTAALDAVLESIA
jgi:4-aminobutyrate aminotransferase-like enzyme